MRSYEIVQWSSMAMTGRLSALDMIVESVYRDETEGNFIREMLVYAYNFVYCYNGVEESRLYLFVLSIIIGVR